MHYQETKYGFEYGVANVQRLVSDKEKGWVTIGIATPKNEIQIYVTKTGKLRVHSGNGIEWKPDTQQVK